MITPTGSHRDSFANYIFILESPVFAKYGIQETTDTFTNEAPLGPNYGAIGTLDGSILTISTPEVYWVPDGQVTLVATYTLVRLT